MSHFSTVKTELRQLPSLRAALEDLGYTPGESQQAVRGYQGQTVDAELAVAVEGSADFGFRWNETSGAYEFVTDLDLWRQPIPCLLYTSPSPRDVEEARMPSSA